MFLFSTFLLQIHCDEEKDAETSDSQLSPVVLGGGIGGVPSVAGIPSVSGIGGAGGLDGLGRLDGVGSVDPAA